MNTSPNLLQVDYILRELDLIRVKGRHASVPVYEVRGMASELIPLKEHRLLETFARGLACYRTPHWAEAIEGFENAPEFDPNDQPSSLM
tara:strand:- start:448 stop:714 length:267 start_codon:yes stop_codon:yes gene_type:complete